MDEQQPRARKQPRVAVVGAGDWGRNLVRNFHELGALACICDLSPMIRQAMAEQYPDVPVVGSFEEVLAQSPQAVAIATTAERHYEVADQALRAGLHTFIEKPLALREEDAGRLIELADDKKLTLMVGHLLQYHSAFLELRRLVMEGALGRVNYICSHRLNLGKFRQKENILWSFAPHDISMILALAGELPNRVWATGASYLHQNLADMTTTHLEFASGIKAHVFVSWLHPFKEQKLVVIGDHAMAVFDDTRPWEEKLLLYPHHIRWYQNAPVPDRAEADKVVLTPSEPLRTECRHFLDCAANGERPRTDGREGLAVLSVLNASQLSLDQGGRRVEPQRPEAGRGGASAAPAWFAHASAVIDEGVSIGEGSKIWHFSHVMGGSRLGKKCNIGQNVVIGPDVTMGNGCKVQNNVSIYKGVTLEDDVFCGPSMVFTNVNNPRAHIPRMEELRPTLVKQGASLGANCTIVCGHTIGRYAFVGAGTVVTKDVPDHALMVGNPAKIIGWVCECGERLDDNMQCPGCGLTYQQEALGLCRKD